MPDETQNQQPGGGEQQQHPSTAHSQQQRPAATSSQNRRSTGDETVTKSAAIITPRPARRLRAVGGFSGYAHGVFFQANGETSDVVEPEVEEIIRKDWPRTTFEVIK
jgi:hypothetical protein